MLSCYDCRMTRSSTFAVLVVLVASVGACGAGAGGAAVRPADPTALEATGESCTPVADHGQPLVVDWKSHERTNLEEAMNDGVAVVAYDCRSLRLLRDCHIDGTYGTLGVSRKEELIALENTDEIRANLPTFGAKLAADFTADIKRGSAINLAMIMIGKKRTTVSFATREQLRGTCEGATHFIRGAFVGAFAMDTGTRGTVGGAAQLFGAETSATSSSSKKVKNKDGDPSVCAQVVPGASALPGGCSAVLRLELSPVAAATRSGTKGVPEERVPTCPLGLVLSDGKCTQPTPTRPHTCNVVSSDCAAQCERGDVSSCAIVADTYWDSCEQRGRTVVTAETAKVPSRLVWNDTCGLAVRLARKACDGGASGGCNLLGTIYRTVSSIGDPREIGARDDKQGMAMALELFKKACDSGLTGGCMGFAAYTHDREAAAALYRRACDGGLAIACYHIGKMYAGAWGSGVSTDAKLALPLFRKSCDGGDPGGCQELCAASKLSTSGTVVTDDLVACYKLGTMLEFGSPLQGGGNVASDLDAAVSNYRKACRGQLQQACDALKRLGK